MTATEIPPVSSAITMRVAMNTVSNVQHVGHPNRRVETIPFAQLYFWSSRWQAGEHEAEVERSGGHLERFSSAEGVIAWLDAEQATPEYELGPSFKRTYKKKPEVMQQAIKECIVRLAENPRHPGLHTHKMGGYRGVWEAYIDSGNRVTFEYRDGRIWLRQNCNHDMLKRNP